MSVPSVIFIGPQCRPGGSETVLATILSQLFPQKISASVVLFGRDQSSAKILTFLIDSGVPYIRVSRIFFFDMWAVFLFPFRAIRVFWRLLQILNFAIQSRPTVICAWSVAAIDAAVLLSLLINKPVILHLHLGLIPEYLPWLRRISLRLYGPRIRHIVCVSFAVRETLRFHGLDKRPCCVIHNSINLQSPPSRSCKRIPGKNVHIACVGAITRMKGQHILIDALRLLLDRGTDRWLLKIIGDAPYPEDVRYKNDLISAIDRGSMNEKVCLTGWQNSPDQMYRDLDLLVMPSISFDAFPTVILESVSRRIPVISSRVGGVPEILIEGDNGWMVQPGDAGRLADAIDDMIQGRKILLYTRPLAFSLDEQVEQLSKLYVSLSRE